MNYEEEKRIEQDLDALLFKFERRERRSFWKGFILAMILTGLAFLMLYLGYQALQEQRREKQVFEDYAHKLEEVNEATSEALFEVSDKIEYIRANEQLSEKSDSLLVASKNIVNSINKNTLRLGDTIFVWANGGLSLRAEPQVGSERLASEDFGKFVTVKNITLDAKNSFRDTIYLGPPTDSSRTTVTGSWINIIDRRQDVEGFMFDGYLSRLPVIEGVEEIDEYIELLPRKYVERFSVVADSDAESDTYSFRRLSMNEVFLLARHVYDWNQTNDVPITIDKSFNRWIVRSPARTVEIWKVADTVKLRVVYL